MTNQKKDKNWWFQYIAGGATVLILSQWLYPPQKPKLQRIVAPMPQHPQQQIIVVPGGVPQSGGYWDPSPSLFPPDNKTKCTQQWIGNQWVTECS